MRRKPITDRMKVQALFYAFELRCAECWKRILPDSDMDWDHRLALALGGPHDYRNIAPLHTTCHAKKTFGTKATTLNSDVHTIAKIKRFEEDIAKLSNGAFLELTRPNERSKPKRKWPKRKMQSRPFPKRVKA